MKTKEKELLSVIVPAYKQEKTIIKDLNNIESVLSKIRYNYEIICVVDGFIDGTFNLLKKKIKSTKIKIYGYKVNNGKGFAIRYGMSKAKGNLIAFIDAGMDINPNGISMLLEHMIWYNSDIIVGSIRHSASKVIGYPLKRKIYSICYHMIIKILFGLQITDSQRGLKIFKRAVLEKVLPKLIVKRFAFDIEILAVAKKLGFKKIHDGPVEMDARRFKYSTIRMNDITEMFIDTLAIYYRLNIINFYKNRKKKKFILNNSFFLNKIQ